MMRVNMGSRALPLRPVDPRLSLRGPVPHGPGHTTLDSPATSLMTDFRWSAIVTLPDNIAVERALDHLIYAGVRFAFVIDSDQGLVGTATAADLQGERVIRHRNARGSHRDSEHERTQVCDVMSPIGQLRVLDSALAAHASVGDIIATLKTAGARHLVVVATYAGSTRLRGLFSATRIEEATGYSLDILPAAAIFAEIEQIVANPARELR